MNDAAIDSALLSAEAEAAEARASQSLARRKWLTRLGLIVLGAGLGYAAWYYLIGQNSVGTDNAYVNAEIAQVTPLVAGAVTEVAVKDTQMVKVGDPLFTIDRRPFQAALDQATAAVAQAQANVAFAQADLERGENLTKGTSITQQTLDQRVQAQGFLLEQMRDSRVPACKACRHQACTRLLLAISQENQVAIGRFAGLVDVLGGKQAIWCEQAPTPDHADIVIGAALGNYAAKIAIDICGGHFRQLARGVGQVVRSGLFTGIKK